MRLGESKLRILRIDGAIDSGEIEGRSCYLGT